MERGRIDNNIRFFDPENDTGLAAYAAIPEGNPGSEDAYSREMPGEAIPALTDRRKTILVPVIQTMKDYILLHYRYGIAAELCRQIADGEVVTGYDIDDIQVIPLPKTCLFRHMTFWRASASAMLGDNDRDRTKPVSFTEMSDIVSSLPRTFHEALAALMKIKHMTVEQLAEAASMSEKTIKRFRSTERGDYTMDQVVALCIGLHLPPWLSCELTARAGLILRDIPEHRAYRYILDCLFMDRIEDVQRLLKENKLEPLNLNATA